ncbi:MAG: HAD-IC family P-type ATPase, partial [Candidatus Thorarchaeota archaeon]
DIVYFGTRSAEEILRLISAVERFSEHPLGEAIVHYADETGVEVAFPDDFVADPGRGVRGRVDGHQGVVGNEPFVEDHSVKTEEARSVMRMFEESGRTVVLASVDGELSAVVAISDMINPGAQDAVRRLTEMGIDVWMLTGDKARTAQSVAEMLGIKNVISEVLPTEKASKVRELQEGGRIVAMVGDGVNDAPALAQANVGIAMGSGTDVSVETGDIVLIRNRLTDVVSGIDLGRRTMTKIRQGFFWAMIYNLALVPLAAGLFYPLTGIALRPEYAGLAMALSSVSVVLNALSLNRVKIGAASEEGTDSQTRGTTAIDPVCKMTVDIASSSLYTDHAGTRYYFCNPMCKKMFDEDPASYVP